MAAVNGRFQAANGLAREAICWPPLCLVLYIVALLAAFSVITMDSQIALW